MGQQVSTATPPQASSVPAPAPGKAPRNPRSPKARGSRSRAVRGALGRWGLTLLALLGALAVWWWVTALEIWSPIFVPSPAAVWERFLAITSEEGNVRGYGGYLLWEHLWASIRRILIGSGIGIVLGVAVGLLIGTVPVIRHAFETVAH